jgi:hypothetical protein
MKRCFVFFSSAMGFLWACSSAGQVLYLNAQAQAVCDFRFGRSLERRFCCSGGSNGKRALCRNAVHSRRFEVISMTSPEASNGIHDGDLEPILVAVNQ